MTVEAGVVKPKKSSLWIRHPQDWYVEPFEASRLLFGVEKFGRTVYDPACGLGRIVTEARAAGYEAWGTDLVARGPACLTERNFLDPVEPDHRPHAIVCNPPFRHCVKAADFIFVRRCLEEASAKVALLLPADWHCGKAVARFLRASGLAKILVLTSRPSMPPGPVIEAGLTPGGGRTNYAWFIFCQGYQGPVITDWLDGPVSSSVKERPHG